MDEKPKRRRGRPPGSKNRPKDTAPPPEVLRPPADRPMDDYVAADPLTLVSRHYAMIDWQQQALRNEMKIGLGAAAGKRVSAEDTYKLVDIGNALMRALDGHKKALLIAKSVQEGKTPAQLLEIAIRKIESQDLPTLTSIIKRLREYRAKLAPVNKREANMMDGMSAARSMAALEAEPEEPDAS